jgi:NAD(P)-dependent dehydrogenase (short-subunit alcohol dehydrogenase family)
MDFGIPGEPVHQKRIQMKQSGKVVLITGAAHGVGCALVHEFLSTGWHVIATDADDLSMAWLLDHEEAKVIKMDITDDASVQMAFAQIRDKSIIIDLIINNAGIDAYFPLSEAPVDQFKRLFEVNVFGAYRVNQIFLPILRQPGGRIIHISSESLNLTVPFMPYPLTKKLVEGYAKALRIELRFSGIDVVIVRPGAIRTRLLETVSRLNPEEGRWSLEKQFKKFAATASLQIGKTISPEQAATFICKVSSIRHPSAVYRINNMLQLRIAPLLPFRWFEKIIFRRLQITAKGHIH